MSKKKRNEEKWREHIRDMNITFADIISAKERSRFEETMRRRMKDDIAYNLLKKQIKDHEEGRCNCDLTEGGYGLCMAGQWLEGVISSEQVIKDLGGER